MFLYITEVELGSVEKLFFDVFILSFCKFICHCLVWIFYLSPKKLD